MPVCKPIPDIVKRRTQKQQHLMKKEEILTPVADELVAVLAVEPVNNTL